MKFNTLFIGNVVKHFANLPSTNVYAIEELAKTKPIDGTVISADHQSAGRGQIGRSWHANAGNNLLLSIILYPKWLGVREQFSLSQAMALGVADTIQHFSSGHVEVKWPNDIYLDGKKICGMLIQNSLSGHHLQSAVVGIGLNVNEYAFPSELPNATSLALSLGRALPLNEVQQALFSYLERRYLQLKSKPAIIRAAYLKQLYRYQTSAMYQRTDDKSVFQGQIIGVERSGQLAMQMPAGHIELFGLKEVIFL